MLYYNQGLRHTLDIEAFVNINNERKKIKMNKVILMGRLTTDPETRNTSNGLTVCRFTVAVPRSNVNKQTNRRDTDFISCTAWRQNAEFISKYFHKGSMIAIEGELNTGKYIDKNHPDVTHYTTDVVVTHAEFTGEKTTQPTTSSYNIPIPF